jgi:hypothetical protein
MATCECGCEEEGHFLEILEVSQPVYERDGGVKVIVQTTKSRRGSCSRCVGCVLFKERREDERA